ncbi:MAG: transcriptional repressor [Armatimonadota bacterium]|nr:transcriptional repressor [Armatimonadota bacterium]MDR7528741.1 transcriptional repressor [Armatimonadota bacterium]
MGRVGVAAGPPGAAPAELRAQLRRRGLRLTAPRRAILAAVRASDAHPSAEAVHAVVRRQLPRVSLATVYRNLRLLARAGLIRELPASPWLRFDGRLDRHHHFTCARCGRLYDVDEPADPRLDARVAARTGFRVAYHRIEFVGVCRRCAGRPRRRTAGGKGGTA